MEKRKREIDQRKGRKEGVAEMIRDPGSIQELCMGQWKRKRRAILVCEEVGKQTRNKT